MPMTAWYTLAGLLAVVAAVSLAVMIHRVGQQRQGLESTLAARKAERAGLYDHIAAVDPAAYRGTFDAIVADVTASDYGDQDTWSDYFAGAPIFDRLCADVAQREAASLDAEWEREAGA